ncbi:MAG: rhamnogalacturonan acetylesterase [Edaphobacter sp.]|uniref:rhamnogalacturonan acetylesterase n=1 Tax=Edaphobacter sp. TaxID=1934404 RepID=UPI0023887052|nr:rhamnogalacturonan acetylesterase [Edaphobacter sp.]MDE1178708.1 rhamnogalacturonan acetylesterase [Edaphobacter sp.]
MMKLLLRGLLPAVLPCSLLLAQNAPPPPSSTGSTLHPENELVMRVLHREPFKIVLTGDSTVATEGGWGPGFCATLTSNVTCVDLALNGRSTKSFIDEGAWQKALDEKGQYYFIQFGHNDQKPKPTVHADVNTTFQDNLRRMVRDVRAQGGIPILVTSLSRRNYVDGQPDPNDGLGDYAAATTKVATEEHVALVDLYHLSRAYLITMTQEKADRFDMVGHPDAKAENKSAAKPDRTHLDQEGKEVFGHMVAKDVILRRPELKPNVNVTSSLPKQAGDH